ncbi:hypothetical protein [Singulisphaera sp. PoT]|uniref:hypothetical protein n=1 Tax=Singulisphaera sp. PoT TaxID=3411797 RepID=UPI003BF5D4EA
MSFVLFATLIIGQAGIPRGDAKVEIDFGTAKIDVFTYKPAKYQDGPMLMVFHGMNRNAQDYRDHARAMGDRFGMIVAAPLFDSAQFGSGKYQQGGLFRNGKLVPRQEWTWSYVPRLADKLRAIEGRPTMPYYLIGHSGGGQFLVRLTAFVPTEASRIVAANPGSDLFPTNELPYPYGFGKLPGELANEETLRAYLARPLTIYLGEKDTVRDEDLDTSREADLQGQSRHERGTNAFNRAKALAASKGWSFGWKLVEAPGIGHDHELMFNAPTCETALFGAK